MARHKKKTVSGILPKPLEKLLSSYKEEVREFESVACHTEGVAVQKESVTAPWLMSWNRTLSARIQESYNPRLE